MLPLFDAADQKVLLQLPSTRHIQYYAAKKFLELDVFEGTAQHGWQLRVWNGRQHHWVAVWLVLVRAVACLGAGIGGWSLYWQVEEV